VHLDGTLRKTATIGAGGLAVACLVALHPVTDALVGIAGCLVLVAVTVTDLERRIVPNRIVVPALVVALVARTALDPNVRWALATVAAGGMFLLIALVYPAGLGMGDVKLAAFLGAWLGWQSLTALLLGVFASSAPALAILARHGPAGRKKGLPLAPFLALGGVIALFAGPDVVHWYRSLGR
jgi:leader peptidase (prepilin peptidase)/N-methyltransferase